MRLEVGSHIIRSADWYRPMPNQQIKNKLVLPMKRGELRLKVVKNG